MKFLSFSALALVLLSIESVLVRSLGLEVVHVDVSMALVVYLALRATTIEGAFSAFAVGYLLDVFTGRPTGLFPFLAVLAFLFVRGAGQILDGRSRASYALFVAISTVAHAVLALGFTWLTSRSGEGHVRSLTGLPMQVLLSTLVGVLLWPLLKRIEPGDRPEPGVLR